MILTGRNSSSAHAGRPPAILAKHRPAADSAAESVLDARVRSEDAVCGVVMAFVPFSQPMEDFLPMALPRHRAVAAFRQNIGFEREDFGFERDHSVIRLIIDTPVTEEHIFQTNGSENVTSGWNRCMSGLYGFDPFTHHRCTNARREHKNTQLVMNIM